MNVKVINGSITFGELYENGGFVGQYEIPTTQVDTEQKVLAWVYHLCEKSWIDIGDIKSFIDCCANSHPTLDIFTKE